MAEIIVPTKVLDGKGRCCGRKPMVYKSAPAHLFCPRCDAAFSPDTGRQIPNWAYRVFDDTRFLARTTQALISEELPNDAG